MAIDLPLIIERSRRTNNIKKGEFFMYRYMYCVLEPKAEELAEKIVKRYKGYGVDIAIKNNSIKICEDRFVYRVKIQHGTRIDDIKKYAEDVQVSLKLPLFQVKYEDLSIEIIASKEPIKDNNFLSILKTPEYMSAKKDLQIPHIVGFDITGKPLIVDLTKYPHMMLSGTTGSGKTIGLKNILLSIILGCSPNKVKLLISDKASEFKEFAQVPHLSNPIITDSNTFLKVMLKLKDELDRRLSMKNSKEFTHLPTIVCVIDEFLSFLSEISNKKMINLAAEKISAILRRGRHVKIHMVLAAHNPTQKNMLIDLSDIQSRMAFQCPKYNNSITILGQGGAEKLRGNGDMLFRSSSNATLQRVQGAFISSEDISTVLNKIKSIYINRSTEKIMQDKILNLKYGFNINEKYLIESSSSEEHSPIIFLKTKDELDDKLLAEIIIWALAHKSISGNIICNTFHIGWRRSTVLIKKLELFGILGNIYAKLPRPVLPSKLDEVTPKTINFLKNHGYTIEEISTAINSKCG